jgi:hypothetical protein
MPVASAETPSVAAGTGAEAKGASVPLGRLKVSGTWWESSASAQLKELGCWAES